MWVQGTVYSPELVRVVSVPLPARDADRRSTFSVQGFQPSVLLCSYL